MSCEHKQLAHQRTFEVSTDYIYCPSRGSKSNANTYLTLDLLPWYMSHLLLIYREQ